MNKMGSTSYIGSKSIRENFFQWTAKWFYSNLPENTSIKPDIPSIICLLQTIGFKLREFEKSDRLVHNKDSVKKKNIRITLECGSSKITAILDMDDIKCECPDNNETKDGSLWSITGTEPVGSTESINKIEKTGSNLLPTMSKETMAVVRDVVHRLFKTINKNNFNQNIDSSKNLSTSYKDVIGMKNTKNLIRSYTDLYDKNYKSKNNTDIKKIRPNSKLVSSIDTQKLIPYKPKLTRQDTYDIKVEKENMEPRPSPRKTTISSVPPEFSISLGDISIQSEEEIFDLTEYVVKAYEILGKAVYSINKKLPINCSISSLQEDNSFVRPTTMPLMNSSFCITSPCASTNSGLLSRSMNTDGSSRPSSVCSMQSRPIRAIPTLKRSTLQHCSPMKMPPMRDRSSSCSVAQRPQPAPSKALLRTASGPTRRNSTNVIDSGLAQRLVSPRPYRKDRRSNTESIRVDEESSRHPKKVNGNSFVRLTTMPLMSNSFCISPCASTNSGLISRSMNTDGSSRPSSVCSMQSRPIRAIPALKRSTLQHCSPMKMPPMRDRSSSCSVAQRPQSAPAKALLRTASGPTRRNSTNVIHSGLDSCTILKDTFFKTYQI
ncbi:PREDICTED: uncharacterized protein LOC105363961 [Ceratosolen solmsi marchali]|uniref:Uncharacterized protein LOC105363961 n=1 Tax=Ceratosolen solmsi marchali TaxID=326594 RepID=A0AAJ6YL61_9HYME|nr:PREDICTED: uncharacterized protein LOC105363961 [Ceratosolen solmsi marchali]